MGFLRRQPKSASAIRFVDHNNKPHECKEWTNDDIVRGTAHFQLPSDTQYTRASVNVRGTITVRINESGNGSLQPNWRTERMRFLFVGKELQMSTRSEPQTGIVDVPFSFDLRELSKYSSLEAPLPPSLDSSTHGWTTKGFHKHDSSFSYEVTYALTATLHSNRGVVASATEQISLLPLGELDPPSYGSLDVPGEFFTTSSRSTRTKFGSRRADDFYIDIAGQEPSPLVLRAPPARSDASTTINLILRFTSEVVKPLPELPRQANIRAQLAAHTVVIPDGAEMSAVQRRHRRDTDAPSFSSKGGTQNCTLSIPGWNKCKPEVDSKGFAIANLEFIYRLPELERPDPSFSTPLLERRYSLDLKVELPSDLGQTLKLSLPVQILYSSPNMRVVSGEDRFGRKDSATSLMRDLREAS